MSVQKIPDNCEGFIPYLIVNGADEAIAFYVKALGGKPGVVLRMQDCTVGHAEVIIGRTRIMLAEEVPQWGITGAKSLGGCPLTLTLYVEDVDARAKQAIDAGMTVKRELADQFYGDRMVMLTDPYGYEWCLGTHVEDVSDEEIQRRMQEMH
ncbi:Glyoxalase-like domain protein [Stieleria maiorica]|uniref:Glyoxalase-like domain protein n=1 Tax=Stieleria maiorica TaxID=2795974 RepID=A0A5B9MNM4_9BACT|nr:VOC family protein [Stieleria maiorica]QEG01940.1 Glyoxalase-like domain protein [Stieleria maiorica]